MKQSKFYLFIIGFFCLSVSAISQDISINILQQPASMFPNSPGTIQVDICNNDPGNVLLPAYKIRPLISVPSSLITIVGGAGAVTGLPAGWSICSNDGTNIRLSNGSNATLAPGNCVTFFINVTSGGTEGGPLTITGTLAFAGGTSGTACTNGAQTVGNLTANDNSTTSVTVFAQGPLPVRSLDLAAVLNDQNVDLKWITKDEQNVSNFELERSTDGRSFTSITNKQAVGNTTGETSYTHRDDVHMLSATVLYYRVKAIDQDAKQYYSKVVPVTLSKAGAIVVWPNPFAGQVNIRINASAKGKALVKFYTSTGVVVKQMEASVSSGTNFITLDGLEHLPKQTYFIQVMINNEKVFSGKLIK